MFSDKYYYGNTMEFFQNHRKLAMDAILETLDEYPELADIKNVILRLSNRDLTTEQMSRLTVVMSPYTTTGRYASNFQSKAVKILKENPASVAHISEAPMSEIFTCKLDRVEVCRIEDIMKFEMRVLLSMYSSKFDCQTLMPSSLESAYEQCSDVLSSMEGRNYQIPDRSRRIYLLEDEPGHVTPRIFCFDVSHLLAIVSGDRVNPFTSLPISEDSIKRIIDSYSLEIKLVSS